MIVVCDTSPICYLLLTDHIQVLPQLFGQVTIPVAVRDELLAEAADPIIRAWITEPPQWLSIQPVAQPLSDLPASLGQGEREAITLAITRQAVLLILDDFDARQAALSYGVTITGLLGVLYRGGTQGFLNFYDASSNCKRRHFAPLLP